MAATPSKPSLQPEGDPRSPIRPWTAEERTLLGTLSDAEIAAKTGRTPNAVKEMRRRHGIAANKEAKRIHWTTEALAKLGKIPDRELADSIKASETCVRQKRELLGVAPCFDYNSNKRFDWTAERVALLGTMTDQEVADQLDITSRLVAIARRSRGIPEFDPCSRVIPEPALLQALGFESDHQLAERFSLGRVTILMMRRALGIESSRPRGPKTPPLGFPAPS